MQEQEWWIGRAQCIWGRSRQSSVAGAEDYGCDAVENPSFRAVNLARGSHPDLVGKHWWFWGWSVPPCGDAQHGRGEVECLSWGCCMIQARGNEDHAQVMGENGENTKDWTHGTDILQKKNQMYLIYNDYGDEWKQWDKVIVMSYVKAVIWHLKLSFQLSDQKNNFHLFLTLPSSLILQTNFDKCTQICKILR